MEKDIERTSDFNGYFSILVALVSYTLHGI
jgi:hypothetical protein